MEILFWISFFCFRPFSPCDLALKLLIFFVFFFFSSYVLAASTKRSYHEYSISGGGGGVGVEEQNHRQMSISPARRSIDAVSPSVFSPSVRKKMVSFFFQFD